MQCSVPCPRSSANIQWPQEDPSGESPNEGLLLSTQDFPWLAKPQQATRAAAASTNDSQVSCFQAHCFFLESVSVLEA